MCCDEPPGPCFCCSWRSLRPSGPRLCAATLLLLLLLLVSSCRVRMARGQQLSPKQLCLGGWFVLAPWWRMERLSTVDFQAIVDAGGSHFDWPPQGRRNTMLLVSAKRTALHQDRMVRRSRLSDSQCLPIHAGSYRLQVLPFALRPRGLEEHTAQSPLQIQVVGSAQSWSSHQQIMTR